MKWRNLTWLIAGAVGITIGSSSASWAGPKAKSKLKKNSYKFGFWGDDEGDEMDWVLEKKGSARKAAPRSGTCTGALSFRCGKSAACKRYFGKIKFRCKATAKQLRSMHTSCNKAAVRYCKSLKKHSAKTRKRCLSALRKKCKAGHSVKATTAKIYRRRRRGRRGRRGRRRQRRHRRRRLMLHRRRSRTHKR